jgi:hypothetical protein
MILDIGINGAFLTRRWEEPENWMRLTKELGYPYHEFCSDVLDPFFSGDPGYQREIARETRAAAARHGIEIWDVYTGVATHRFHGLSHSHESPRRRMRDWIVACIDLALEIGTDRIGGHWDAFSVEVLSDPVRKGKAWDRIVGEFRELAAIGRQKGLRAIYNEQMYIPSEVPWTLAEGERFLHGVNQGSPGCPVRLTVDVGHQAGMHYGLTGPDLDYREWLRRFGAQTEIVHLQQTTPDGSHHWPFTAEYESRGHVRIDAVIQALRESIELYRHSPLGADLPPVERAILIAEVIPGSTKTEEKLLEELSETARFLRKYVPDGGLVL